MYSVGTVNDNCCCDYNNGGNDCVVLRPYDMCGSIQIREGGLN